MASDAEAESNTEDLWPQSQVSGDWLPSWQSAIEWRLSE